MHMFSQKEERCAQKVTDKDDRRKDNNVERSCHFGLKDRKYRILHSYDMCVKLKCDCEYDTCDGLKYYWTKSEEKVYFVIGVLDKEREKTNEIRSI